MYQIHVRRFLIGMSWCPVLCSVLLVLPSVAQEQRPSKLASWSTLAVVFFVEMKDTFNEMVILPAARENLVRHLRVFSRQLFELQQRKSNLTQKLLSIQSAGDESVRENRIEQARNDISSLTETVGKMRGSLTQILEALPPDYREKGNKVVGSLELGFHEKWTTLNEISEQLIGRAFDQEKIKQEGERTVELLNKLKDTTDEFLNVVEKKGSS